MNKVYKVIWNASIGAWVATSEIAKNKTKTKSKTLNVSAAVLSGVICFAPNAFAGTNTEGGIGQGTSISGTTSCREGNANTANQKDIAIGCGAQTQDRTGSNIANRNNPYNNSTGAYAGAMKQGGAISVGTGAVVEKGLGTAIGSYATTQGISGVAIGTGALSSGNTALAVGRQSAATADFSQAIGNVAAATGKGSLAIGHSATAEGYRSIAIGSPDIENADPVAGQAGAAYQPKMATKATGKDSIAFGGGAVATEENALAIGAFSESKGKKSVAIGTGAKAQKDNAVVIGDQAEASFEGGVAIGKGARSEAENSIALGKDSKASQATGESFLTKQSAPTGVLSIGDIGTERRIQNVADGAADSDAATVRQLKAARTHYVSINDNGQQGGNFENDGATGRNAIAVGVNASAAGREAMAIGGSTQAIGSGAIAMGSSSQTVGRGDVAIGRNASTQGAEGVNSNQSVAIGDQTKAIGADVIAKGNSSVAIGGDDVDKIARDTELSNTYTEITGGTLQAGKYPTTEANHGSTAVGVQAVGTGAFSSAFGMTSKATGDASSAFGVMSNASGKGAAAFGAVAQATGDGASAMGINSLASGTNSTAIGSGNKPGEGAKATGNSSAAIGSGAQATGDNSAAIGKGAEATNENAAAVGGGAKATGKNAAAIGGGAIADQENAVAVGQGAQSLVQGGVALGARSKVEAKNSVALGQDAVATEATGTSFLTNRDASQSNGVISVGSAGKERRITNVEDGSADSDAVTVRQLKNVDSRVNQNTSNIGKNTQNITNLNQKLDDTKTNLGNQIADTNKNLNDAKKDLGIQITDTNTKLNTTKDQLTTQINDTKTELNNTIGNTKTELNSKIDNTKTELENKGLNFAGNSGSDVHRKLGDKLNIVGGAAASTPAAKTSGENIITRTTQDGIQIELLKDSKFDSVTTGNTTLNTNGLTIKEGPSITKQGINAGSKQITNIADGINAKDAVNVDQLTKVKENLNGRITDTNNQLNDAKKDLGNQIADTNKNLNDAKKDLGIQITDTNTKLNTTKDQLTTQINDTKTELNNTIGNTKTELNSKIDNTKTELENKGLNFAGNSGSDVHRKLGDKLNIVGGAAASTPAAKTSGENVITRTTQDGIQIELLKDSKFDSVTTGNTTLNTNGLTIKEGASITKEGINAGGKQITNVADGINAKDAVNKSQLDNLAAKQNATDDAAVKYDDAKTKDKVTLKGKDGTVLDNVKAGHISSTSKEAVNGSQIHNISNSIKNSIGGNTVVNPDGSLTTNNIGGTGKNNINDAISEVKNTATKAKTTVTEGDNIVVKETVNKDGSTNYEVSTKKDLTLNSVTTGDSVLNNNGLTIKEGASITKEGINAGGKQITNVADGINAKDAVNVDQLSKVKENLNGRITDTNNQLNDAKKDLGDQINNTNTKLNTTKDQLTTQINDTKTELNNTIGNTKTELNSKIDSTKTELENKGLNFAGNSGADVHRKLGEKLNIIGGAAASTPATKTSGENVITRTTKDGIQIELLKDSKFDSVTTGNTTLNTNGLTIKEGPSITKDGINAGGKQITNVADGINAKDAVNKSQLDNLAAKQNATDDAAVKYDDAKTKDKVTLKGKDGTVLDNVKAGHISSTSKEAVNGSQIHNISNSIKNSIGGNTVVNPDGSLTTNNIGGTGKNNINDAISEVKNTATKAKTTVTEGDNIVVKETVNKDGSTNYEVSTKKDLTLNSVTTGDSVLNNNGLTIKEGPSITKEGINAGGKKITNVADGVNAKDAVNVDQLTKVKDNLNGRITDTNNQLNDAKKDLGNQIADTNNNLNEAKKDFGDQIADTNTKLNNTKDQLTTQINDTKTELNNTIGNTKTELNTKIDNTKTELENKGLNFAGNSGADVHRKLGEKLNIVGGAAASTPAAKTSGENVITRTTKDGIQIELLKDSKFDSVTTGNTTLNTNGLTIKEGPSITKEGINAGGKQITNVADGINAKDAVNKSQLDNLAAKQNATDDAAVKYDDAKTKDKVTLKGKDGTVLDNVKAGHISSTSKEAVNGSQIHNISNSIKNSIGGNTVVNPDGSLTTNNIGGTGKNNINDAISEVKNTATKAKTTVTEGDNIVVKETVNKDGSTNYEVSTKKDLTLNSVTTGDSVLNNNGLTIKDGPSMTRDGINAGGKKITDVANGVIAQNSKDAVNGGQVHHISNSIKNSIGGNTVVNPDGSLTTNNIGGTGKNNINDAIKSVDEKVTNGVNDLTQKGLNFGANDQKATQGKAVHRKLGDTINIVGGADAKTAEDKTSGENIITRTTEDGVKIEMLKDVKFDSVNVGSHVLNQQGLIIKGGPSITVNGINAGGKQITNVADGINAKDAVNKGQLDKQINEVKDQIGKDIGKLSDHVVQYDKDKNGNVDKNSVTLGGGEKGTNLKNVADGKIAEGSKDAVNGGQLWNVQNQVDKNSNDIKNIQNNIDNISNGKAGLVQQQKPNGEITVGKDSGGTSINMAGKEGDRVVQGVKDGEIKAGSNQAVNGGQIHKISESIKNSIGGNTTIDPKDGSITTNNIGGTGKNNINDAIGTLNQSNQELGNKITNLGDQLQQVFYDTNKRIDDVEKKANAGIAAAMALENAPFVAGKYTYAVGAAYHGGENAVGVTLRKTSDNGRWSITGGVAAASQGEPSVRVGISGVIN
ncbi:trimeric autotransporter adhesin Ata [Acinetobacter baumannii]|uniref:trimeric autotransporter adhesin Ata n=2 Tax=Acinetobacter baumannii TaxID=470 RepID=UPI001EFBE44C|nr:trimeric autotransporter adhesin Ata [Acinetobacter baumannii]